MCDGNVYWGDGSDIDMFNFLKQKPKGEIVTFKIQGMHCTSCAMNIDGSLEDLDGVVEAKTSYVKSETKVIYDPTKVTRKQMLGEIEKAGYSV